MNKAPTKTFCNPLNLDYEYRVYDEGGPVCIEAADPVVVLFRDRYFLFSSVTHGYWHSDDLVQWAFLPVTEEQLPQICGYAPAAMVMDGYVYWHQGEHDRRLFRTSDPLDPARWELVTDNCYVGHDPFLFYDETEDRVWASYGCNELHDGGIKVVELDRNTLEPKGEVYECVFSDQEHRGWERPLDNHTKEGTGWIEGSQIFRFGDRWYLTYSGFSLHKGYANGVCIADAPTGDYRYAPDNPCSHKNTGYIGSAGHGCFFTDKFGNWWNITCASVNISHPFDRRLNLFPASIDGDGLLHAHTAFSDYPITVPTGKRDQSDQSHTPWMLLSEGRPCFASSQDINLPLAPDHGKELAWTTAGGSRYDHRPALAFDEDVRTFWAAASKQPGEWLCVDLERECTVCAIQLGFPLYNVTSRDDEKRRHQYIIEYGTDPEHMSVLIDKSDNTAFVPHDYLELETPVRARFLKITGLYTAGDGQFAVGDFRIFGNDGSPAPAAPTRVTVTRDRYDSRNCTVTWDFADGADGYLVRYGHSPDKLYNQYQVTANKAEIRTLTTGIRYYFRVDAFNGGGCTEGTEVFSLA